MTTERETINYQVAVANRVLAEMGLADGPLASLGHASMRVPSNPDTFVVKGRGYEIDALAAIKPEHMVLCDADGNLLDGPPGSSQCYEVKLHSSIYKSRPDVSSIVHVHPRHTVVMSVLGATLVPMCREGIELVRTPLPVFPHIKLILTEQDGQAVAAQLGGSTAVLLQGHGAITTGRSLGQAVMNMAHLEEQAKMNWYAYCAAGPDYPGVPEELLEESVAQPTPADLPHFGHVTAGGTASAISGAYTYYADIVSRDLTAPA
jgi:ribulose-5-phosphate 4-epimerase/fuculose-1-phosphate aldolase